MRKENAIQGRDASTFSARCMRAGVNHRGCGLAALEIAQRLALAPIVPERGRTKQGRACFIVPGDGNGALGALIRNGLAEFVPDQSHYAITPKGGAWLDALKAENLV
jgi:hypothetical protein